MQSSANVQLSPEEEVTMSVSANDFGDSVKAGVCVAGMTGFPVRDCDEGVPLIAVQELKPALFERLIQDVPRPTRIRARRACDSYQMQSSQLQLLPPHPRVTGTDPAVFGPLLDPSYPPGSRRLTGA